MASRSSTWSHYADAKAFLESSLEINRSAGRPCEGEVVEVAVRAEIVRHCEGAEAQAVGARCPKCREIVEAPDRKASSSGRLSR